MSSAMRGETERVLSFHELSPRLVRGAMPARRHADAVHGLNERLSLRRGVALRRANAATDNTTSCVAPRSGIVGRKETFELGTIPEFANVRAAWRC